MRGVAWRWTTLSQEPGSCVLRCRLGPSRSQGEDGPGKRDFVGIGMHNGAGAVNREAGLTELFGGCRIALVYDQHIEEVVISLGHASDGNREFLRGHQCSGRPGHGRSADDWAYSGNGSAGGAEGIANSGD